MSENDAFLSATVRITGHGGAEIEAYAALLQDETARGGVVVIHHLPGYDEATKEIVRRFGHLGYNAVMPNLFWHDAPGAAPDDAAAAGRAKGGVPDERLVGDVAGAAEYLRSLPNSNGKAGVIGFCSGGRQSVLAACSLPLDAAVDCYGAFVTGDPSTIQGHPMRHVAPLYDKLPDLHCPLLGLFGADDQHPSAAEVAELEQILTKLGKPFEFHSYPDAGHAFFMVERPAFRPAAAKDGWERIGSFFGKHLSA
ncbi:dienelactone hydrolase family protein [Actinocrinis puniceicyclus]|uniref:Dienelactone hydrolase family protein n=1 Tax=Actinocrinis puniceicyclus TaxID=977794 RepID=A0A8J8BF60_9ACTN|nr:dienelactone hydrolase family protein [Actinocrinis puniceicyclus]MBS2964434.1 dienelactone hydrolase family protein [Actinocrinis puniceicyclus]